MPGGRVTAIVETPREAKRRVSRHGGVALAAMLAPALLFPMLLALASQSERFAFLRSPATWPVELWTIALSGTIATVGGLFDWRYHRSGETAVGRAEHRAHVLALAAGGLPLFALMTAASVVARPALLLVPIVVVGLSTTVLICYDEFAFHRRCGRFETLTHRALVLGNGLAWLAWLHWLFVRPALA